MTATYTRHPTIWDEATKTMKQITVEIEIDIDELARELGRRANRSKTGKSCIHGSIIVARKKETTT